MNRLALALALLTAPAFANNLPDPPQSVPFTPGDGEPTAPYVIQHYSFCCEWKGRDRYHPAFNRDPVQAALQCSARVMSYAGDLPDCSADVGAMIDRADGGVE